MIKKFFLRALIHFVAYSSFSQTETSYTWYDPLDANYPVISGRYWQTNLQQPYDRLPAKAEQSVRKEVWQLSHNTAGEYIDFKTSSNTIVIRYKITGSLSLTNMSTLGVSGLDLYARDINGAWQWAMGSYNFGDTVEYRFSNLFLSAKQEEFRLYLPLYNTVSWMNIGVAAGTSFTFLPVSDEQPLVMYGTSILQGASASRPGLAWTNIVGRKLDRHIVDLGFSGNALLEQPVIDLMNEINAKLYVLDCLPNLYDKNKYPDAEVESRIINAVKSLQSKHPQTPIILTAHASGAAGLNNDTALTNKYARVNTILAQTFLKLQQQSIKHIFLLADTAIGFNTESTTDGTHPNDAGMMQYADAYEKIIREIFNEPKGLASTTIPVRQRRDYAKYDFMQRHEAVLKTIKTQKPAVVLIGNSIIHFWGGPPEAGINNGISSWKKCLEPLKTINLGFGWDRIENVLWRVYHGELDSFAAKKIVVTIGTNNLSINNSDEAILDGLQYLVTAIHQRQPGAAIFLSGIYPRRNMEEHTALLNKKIAALAKTLPVKFIDPGIDLLGKDKRINELLFSDGLHPNSDGYEKLGAELYAYLSDK